MLRCWNCLEDCRDLFNSKENFLVCETCHMEEVENGKAEEED
jgi:hypothetical protein